MPMQVILDSSFARPGSVPIWGGKKGEFRDWTRGRDAHASRPRISRGHFSLVNFCKGDRDKIEVPDSQRAEDLISYKLNKRRK